MIELNKIYFEDCMETMKRIPDGSIDLMLTDPPYNITACEWDRAIDLPALWEEWLRIVKLNGAFVFTASQPFTSKLIMSKLYLFKYELIWNKVNPTGHLNVKIMPMKLHENIIIFGNGKITYNRQMTSKPKIFQRENMRNTKVKNPICEKKVYGKSKFGLSKDWEYNKTNPQSIITIPNGNGTLKRANIHPTQKPIDLFRYLIKTYSNEGDTVFDGYSGSGTTAEACIEEKRNFIVSENKKEYFDLSEKRIKNYLLQQTLTFL